MIHIRVVCRKLPWGWMVRIVMTASAMTLTRVITTRPYLDVSNRSQDACFIYSATFLPVISNHLSSFRSLSSTWVLPPWRFLNALR